MKLYKYFVMAALAVTGLAATSCGEMDHVVDAGSVHMWMITITGDGVSDRHGLVAVGETLQLSLQIIPEKADVIDPVWSSGDESVATIDANGLVTGMKSGKTVISVYSEYNPAVKADMELTVAGGTVKISKKKVDQKDAD